MLEEMENQEQGETGDERANRYQGHASTWRAWTEAERMTAKSLDTLRTEDLGLHLYNAYAQSQGHCLPDHKARSPTLMHGERSLVGSSTSDVEEKKEILDGIHDDADLAQSRPPKGWTSWPMLTDSVPRGRERKRNPVAAESGSWVNGVERVGEAREVFEDLLIGEVLRAAKERFSQRMGKEIERLHHGSAPAEQESPKELENPLNCDPGKETGQINELKADGSDHDVHDVPDSFNIPGSLSKPVVMTDDYQAQKLLQPVVRRCLTKLDKLLMGLHHARQGYKSFSLRVMAEDRAGTDSRVLQTSTVLKRRANYENVKARAGGVDSTKNRGRGRPRKAVAHAGTFSLSTKPALKSVNDSGSDSKRKRRTVGRPMKYQKPLHGETYYMMRRRLREDSSAHGPATDDGNGHGQEEVYASEVAIGYALGSSKELHNSHTPTEQSHSPARCHLSDLSSNDSKSRGYGKARLGPRDWADILGVASMVGFDIEVVRRSAERCAAIFEERMTFRTLEESDALLRGASHTAIDSNTINNLRGTPELPAKIGNVIAGLHNDGFLEPIIARQGWRGKDIQRRTSIGK
ncbi:MAG: hypothetical protein M1827_002030 [Pycnora praestabilis]|nr:MAG: hypothetical protein M1827_002030 [Pycnora praestabilis]